MPTDAATHQPGVGPPGRRDVILQLLRVSAEPRSITSFADDSACTRTRFGFTSTRWCARAASNKSSVTPSVVAVRRSCFAPAVGWTRQDRPTIGFSPEF